jgi:ferrochelatase
LAQFLLDPYVLDTPWFMRFIVVFCFILPFRPKKTAEAYSKIWTQDGSPLVSLTKALRDEVQKKVDVPVEIAMRYGSPSIEAGIQLLFQRLKGSFKTLHLIPLYPHYTQSSFLTATEEVRRVLRHFPGVELTVQAPFYKEVSYLDSLANSAKPYLEKPFDHVLLSYHGIPERHVKKADPTHSHCLKNDECCQRCSPEVLDLCYKAQVYKTSHDFASILGLKPDQYSVAFQSRLGRDPWLQPFTDYVLEELPAKGVKRLLVICPSFVSDCLETLEEIAIRAKETFLGAGGESFEYIPCINLSSQWVDAVAGFIKSKPGI